MEHSHASVEVIEALKALKISKKSRILVVYRLSGTVIFPRIKNFRNNRFGELFNKINI